MKLKVCLKFIGCLYGEATPDLNKIQAFYKEYLEGSKLPPTDDSAIQHIIRRANYQCFIWKHARDRNLSLSSPADGNGWAREESGSLVPMFMDNNLAPQSLLELVVCRSKKGYSSGRCSCRKAKLSCTLPCDCINECGNNPKEDGDEEPE